MNMRIIVCKQCHHKFEHWVSKNNRKKEYCDRCTQKRGNERTKQAMKRKKDAENIDDMSFS